MLFKIVQDYRYLIRLYLVRHSFIRIRIGRSLVSYGSQPKDRGERKILIANDLE